MSNPRFVSNLKIAARKVARLAVDEGLVVSTVSDRHFEILWPDLPEGERYALSKTQFNVMCNSAAADSRAEDVLDKRIAEDLELEEIRAVSESIHDLFEECCDNPRCHSSDAIARMPAKLRWDAIQRAYRLQFPDDTA